ncbi:MAG: DUF6476 family protein [Albidovulum sp.]
MADIRNAPAPEGEDIPPPPDLRFLKLLVTILAGTMIIGLITIIVLFVIRLPGPKDHAPRLPPQIVLPAGESAEAVTFGRGWTAVVTSSGKILIFDAENGKITQELQLNTAN